MESHRLRGAHSGGHFVGYTQTGDGKTAASLAGCLPPAFPIQGQRCWISRSQPASFASPAHVIELEIRSGLSYDTMREARLAPMQICHLPSRPPRDIFEDCNAPQISHRGRLLTEVRNSPNSLPSPISPLQVKRSPKFSPILQTELSQPEHKYSSVRGGKFLPIDADKCHPLRPAQPPLFPSPIPPNDGGPMGLRLSNSLVQLRELGK